MFPLSMPRSTTRATKMDACVTALEASNSRIEESFQNLAVQMSKFMASMDTHLSLVESRSATMEEQGCDHVGPLELGGNPIYSDKTFSDQNLNPNFQFQHQDPQFHHQDFQF